MDGSATCERRGGKTSEAEGLARGLGRGSSGDRAGSAIDRLTER